MAHNRLQSAHGLAVDCHDTDASCKVDEEHTALHSCRLLSSSHTCGLPEGVVDVQGKPLQASSRTNKVFTEVSSTTCTGVPSCALSLGSKVEIFRPASEQDLAAKAAPLPLKLAVAAITLRIPMRTVVP